MTVCWEMVPKERPTFAKLKVQLDELHSVLKVWYRGSGEKIVPGL